MTWTEWHHGYLGLTMLGAGLVLGVAWLWIPGAYLALDDAAQHFLGWPSPAKWAYLHTLWRIPAVRQFNAWLDRLFHG